MGSFLWNKSQKYLHARIEDQLKRTGRVRVAVLKGRQQGVSTYTAARFYHRVTRNRGKNCFILSHHATTTGTLFQIVEKYHLTCPAELKPNLITANNRQMKFDNQSQYTVGTAGSGAIGRGDTNQYFHGSEVAFYDNTDEITTGVMQTVADLPGTEMILESTANGVGNYFYQVCMDALEGKGDYELIFIPWFWQDEYTKEPPEDFVLDDEEIILKKTYNLTNGQLYWRRNKIIQLKSVIKFKQEYPFTVQEAFQASGFPLINPLKVQEARKDVRVDTQAPLILGVDPGPLKDRTCVTWRQGRHWIKTETFHGISQMELAGKLANRIEKHAVDAVFVDVAEGRGCVDRMKELGYGNIVHGVSFAERPSDELVYLNKRSEMAGLLRDWIEDEAGCNIPDEEDIAVELAMVPVFKTSSNGKNQLKSKDEIKRDYNGKSTDIFDSAILTFARPVRSVYNVDTTIRKRVKRRESEIHASNRRQDPRRPFPDGDFDGQKRTVTRKPSALRKR